MALRQVNAWSLPDHELWPFSAFGMRVSSPCRRLNLQMLLTLICAEPISRKLLQAPKPDFRNYNYYWAVDFNVTLLVR